MVPIKRHQLIRIMIVEDHVLFREGLKGVLQEIPWIEVVGEAENGVACLELLRKVRPDIILMDIKMPVMDGLEATEEALRIMPGLKIIVITMFGEEDYLYAMIQKGISGFILKTAKIYEIERAIELVSGGGQYFSSEINGLLARKLRQYTTHELVPFTGRENEVLKMLCNGFSTSEISSKLHLSKRTVEGYRARLLEKTKQPNVINLILYSLKNKLVSIDEIEPWNPDHL